MCKTTTKILKNKTFEEERSLYRVNNYTIDSCLFEGKVDGESPLKEVNYINVINSNFSFIAIFALSHAIKTMFFFTPRIGT